MAESTLFRPEVLAAKRGEWLGSVILVRPVSFALVTAFAVLCAGAILAFLFFGVYTKRTQVAGLLVPDRGLIKVMAQQPGVVVESRVKEGQSVKEGDVLYVLSSERLTDNTALSGDGSRIGVGTNAVILKTVRARQESLKDEHTVQARLTAQQHEQIARRILDLRAEVAQIDKEITTQAERVASARSLYQRYRILAGRHFLSELALQQKQDELLDQQGRHQALQRNRLALFRELTSAQSELAQLPGQSELKQAQIARMNSELEQTGVAAEAQRRILVTAPQDGTVTAILAEPGQTVDNHPLLTLLPANSRLEAQLYVPSRAAGFIEPGQKVLIRYAAYPYQKFGQYEGTVVDVSRTALSPQEIPAQLASSATPPGGGEGLYRIEVTLAAQTATAYGKPQPLAAGMALEADVLQDTRSLIEWVLEPLYSLKGKVS
jgi:membrane fusion protein